MTELEYLAECFCYDPETGVFVWNKRPRNHFIDSRVWKIWNTRFSGKRAGAVNETGYRQICLDYNIHYEHRLAWLVMTGELPEEIDHIDHDRANNRLSNLRSVNRAENCRNQSLSSANTSGFTGVSWSKANKKWRAEIGTRKNRMIMHFDSAIAAARAVSAVRSEIGFHSNHGA